MSRLDCETCGHCTRRIMPAGGIIQPCGVAHAGDDADPAYRPVLRWLDRDQAYRDNLRDNPGDCPGHRPRTEAEQAAWEEVIARARASRPPKVCRHCGGTDP